MVGLHRSSDYRLHSCRLRHCVFGVGVRGSWIIGFLLLLPGNLPAMAVGQTLIHFPTAYIFFPATLVSNLLLWLMWLRLCRTFRAHNFTE